MAELIVYEKGLVKTCDLVRIRHRKNRSSVVLPYMLKYLLKLISHILFILILIYIKKIPLSVFSEKTHLKMLKEIV